MSPFDDVRELPLRQIWDGIHARMITGNGSRSASSSSIPARSLGSIATSTSSSGW